MIPLSEIIVDFYNELKARTRGYASMDYYDRRVPRLRTWSSSTFSSMASPWMR